MSKFFFFTLGFIVTTILLSVTGGLQSLNAAPVTMDINKAKDPGPGFTDEKIGTLAIDARNDTLDITANLTLSPGQDKVFEAWLVDTNGSDYMLSLGPLDGSNLNITETMVNPYTYTQFIITEEPVLDVDPNAAGTFGGTELDQPFGQ